MFANYHTHTALCCHATGSDEEYVTAAIENGVNILGFSDHTPQVYPAGFTDPMRMRVDEFHDYCASVLSLKEKYKNAVEIHLGLEVEYFPTAFPKLCALMKTEPIEYIILGQHIVGDHGYGESVWSCNATEEDTLRTYVSQTSEALRLGCFTYFAHPDLICTPALQGSAVLRDEMARLLSVCLETDTPVECNLLGLCEGRHYPHSVFWELAGEMKPKVVLGCDAHSPARSGNRDEMAQGRAFLEKYGLSPMETVSFKNPIPSLFRL